MQNKNEGSCACLYVICLYLDNIRENAKQSFTASFDSEFKILEEIEFVDFIFKRSSNWGNHCFQQIYNIRKYPNETLNVKAVNVKAIWIYGDELYHAPIYM
ncbi:hypothetical protein FF38_00845 [Lucilia cuprina]|uniref:Uncharacterized protein n=1 Tax=Lucilia cuprina TaxID=7375 RepID=A0A0L0C1X6_LUCCU|nr:hypothetical protein FF38_00845 [Lucilia cuprina]